MSITGQNQNRNQTRSVIVMATRVLMMKSCASIIPLYFCQWQNDFATFAFSPCAMLCSPDMWNMWPTWPPQQRAANKPATATCTRVSWSAIWRLVTNSALLSAAAVANREEVNPHFTLPPQAQRRKESIETLPLSLFVVSEGVGVGIGVGGWTRLLNRSVYCDTNIDRSSSSVAATTCPLLSLQLSK